MRIVSTITITIITIITITIIQYFRKNFGNFFRLISSRILWVIRGAKNTKHPKYRLNEEEIKWLRKQAFISFE